MKKAKNVIWGLVLVVIGVIWALNVLNITDITLFFDGWWTLIIIVPCVIGLFTDRDRTANLIGVAIGVALLLACQDIIEFEWLWKLMVPVVVVIIGLNLIFKDAFGKKAKQIEQHIKAEGKAMRQCCATFSGNQADYSGEHFEGAELNAIFGGVKCDLRGAIIEQDAVINATSIFGGIDIFVPANVNVKISATCIFGGIDDKRAVKTANNEVTLYIRGLCLFGGVDIK